MSGTLCTVARYILAAAFVFAGVMHFVKPAPFVAIVPDYLPAKEALVAISGVAEIAGGIGLLIPQVRFAAGLGLCLLLIAVFPANIYMVMNNIPWEGKTVPPALLWGRLPLQLVLLACVWWVAIRKAA